MGPACAMELACAHGDGTGSYRQEQRPSLLAQPFLVGSFPPPRREPAASSGQDLKATRRRVSTAVVTQPGSHRAKAIQGRFQEEGRQKDKDIP